MTARGLRCSRPRPGGSRPHTCLLNHLTLPVMRIVRPLLCLWATQRVARLPTPMMASAVMGAQKKTVRAAFGLNPHAKAAILASHPPVVKIAKLRPLSPLALPGL